MRLGLRNTAVADTIRTAAAALQTPRTPSCAAAITGLRLQIDGTNLRKPPAVGELHGPAASPLVQRAAHDSHLAIEIGVRLEAVNKHTRSLRDV